MSSSKLAVRWTIGDVSPRGFDALRISIWGAYQCFGPDAAYAVCVNTVPLALARARTGVVPRCVRWLDASQEVPEFLRAHLDPKMAEGAAWKLAPLRLFPDRYELSLDNDCILWSIPEAMRAWLEDVPRDCVLVAEDVRAAFGKLSSVCNAGPRNLGIRGLPPGFDVEAAMRDVLAQHPISLTCELDEQGLQMATLERAQRVRVVPLEDVSICSPIPPHTPQLGRSGAHFCGLNAKRLGFQLEGRAAELHIREHWERHRDTLLERVGLQTQAPLRKPLLTPAQQRTSLHARSWNRTSARPLQSVGPKEFGDMDKANAAQAKPHFLELARSFDNAMLATHAADCTLHARPMLIAEVADDGDIWFVTSVETPKVDELEHDGRALVLMQQDGRYLSIMGQAEIRRDAARVRELWSESWAPWLKDKNNPDLVLIRVRSQTAEYWDASGIEGVKLAVRAATSYISGEPMSEEDTDVETHAKVSF